MKITLLIGFISVVASALILTNGSSHAVSGDCYFTSKEGPVNATGKCSVSGLGNYGTNDVLSGRSTNGNGSAIPGSVNTKSEFINFILDRFETNKSDQNRVGAAFIMQEMRGSHAWPSNSARDDWVRRMNNDNVTVKREWDSSVGRTSWFDSGKDNTFYADHPNVGRTVINIYQKGKRVAQIETLCGNMVAGTIALSEPWTATPNTTVTPAPVAPSNTAVVGPGQPVTWTHTIRANGPADTDVPIKWTVDVNDAVLGSDKTDTWVSGRSPGQVLTRTYNYTTTDADVGKTLCQRIRINPSSSTGGSDTSTNNA